MTEQNLPDEIESIAQVAQEEITTEPPKRKMGNPNWVKGYKRKEYFDNVSAKEPKTITNEPMSHLQDDLVWLKMFTAMVTHEQCNCSGSALNIAATQADYALTLYKSRFN